MKHTKIIFSFCLVAIILFASAFAARNERSVSAIEQNNTEKTSSLSATAKPIAEPKNISEPLRLQERVLVPEKSPSAANFILVTDVLDGFGGQKYGSGCDLSYFAGGQSSPIGAGNSTNYKLSAGFIYPTVVSCGDVNMDGIINVGDVVYVINYLYRNGLPPDPLQTADINCDGVVNVGDVVYLINYLYRGGDEPIC